MMNKQPTAQEIEQAKTDPLYICLILRQRMRNELQFAPGAHRMSIARDPSEYPFGVVNDNSNNHTFSDIHAHAPQVARSIPLFESELEILLKHFASHAEKANDLAGQLAAVRKQGEIWMRDAKHANDLIGRVMHLFARDQWRVEKQEDLGWMIHSPRIDGMASHTVVWEDSQNPAEALLALILDAAIESGEAGELEGEPPTI